MNEPLIRMQRLAGEAKQIALKMTEDLRTFSKTQHRIFSAQMIGVNNGPVFPEDFQHKKLDARTANTRYNKYIAEARNEAETASENDLKQVELMKEIMAEGNEKIRNLYKTALKQPV